MEQAKCKISVLLDPDLFCDLGGNTSSLSKLGWDAGSSSSQFTPLVLSDLCSNHESHLDEDLDSESHGLEQGNQFVSAIQSSTRKESGVLAGHPAKQFEFPAGNVIVNTETKPIHNVPLRSGANGRQVERVAFGMPFPRRTVSIQPWRGPLPMPRPTRDVTLEAFLPPNSNWSHKPILRGNIAVMAGTPLLDVASSVTAHGSSQGAAMKFTQSVIYKKTVSGPSTADLIKKAKAFGRPRSCLLRGSQSKVDGRYSLLKPASSSGNLCNTRSPSYAEMAARPPPPTNRAGDSNHRPVPSGNRNPTMAAPMQGGGWRGQAPSRHGQSRARCLSWPGQSRDAWLWPSWTGRTLPSTASISEEGGRFYG
jgi:hypothetical protein